MGNLSLLVAPVNVIQSDMLGRFVMLAHEKTSRGGDAFVKEIRWLAWPIRVALCRSVCAGITY